VLSRGFYTGPVAGSADWPRQAGRDLDLRGAADVADPSEELLHDARVLDRYYIEARYLNGFPAGAPLDYFDRALSEEAIDAADAIVRHCRDHLR
jgi:HEPN domain-containing protein